MVGRSSYQEAFHKKEAGFKVGKVCLIYGLNSEKRGHLLKTASGLDKVTIKKYNKGRFSSMSNISDGSLRKNIK